MSSLSGILISYRAHFKYFSLVDLVYHSLDLIEHESPSAAPSFPGTRSDFFLNTDKDLFSTLLFYTMINFAASLYIAREILSCTIVKLLLILVDVKILSLLCSEVFPDSSNCTYSFLTLSYFYFILIGSRFPLSHLR